MIVPRNYTERLRHAEFDLISGDFGADDRVLELGGGSGFLQACIAARVRECISIDVAPHPDPVGSVTLYDGKTLPFEDASFDVIFSSSVLEHIADIDGMLAEFERVLKPGGRMIHIMPTHWWRIWTLLSYYPSLPVVLSSNLRNLKAEAGRGSGPAGTADVPAQPQASRAARLFRRFRWKWLRTIAICPRHGERGNEISEIMYFRPGWWRDTFRANGWVVTNDQPCGMFYSGNILFGEIFGLRQRRALSKVLGSATWIFRVARADTPG